jgi:hypothetical protein
LRRFFFFFFFFFFARQKKKQKKKHQNTRYSFITLSFRPIFFSTSAPIDYLLNALIKSANPRYGDVSPTNPSAKVTAGIAAVMGIILAALMVFAVTSSLKLGAAVHFFLFI